MLMNHVGVATARQAQQTPPSHQHCETYLQGVHLRDVAVLGLATVPEGGAPLLADSLHDGQTIISLPVGMQMDHASCAESQPVPANCSAEPPACMDGKQDQASYAIGGMDSPNSISQGFKACMRAS